MLRIKVDLIPFGDEALAKPIGELIIANTGNAGYGSYEYHAVRTDDSEGTYFIGPVLHTRSDGLWTLIERVLQSYPMPKSDEPIFEDLKQSFSYANP